MSTLDELLAGGGAADQSAGTGMGTRLGRGLAYAMAVGNGDLGGLLRADEFFRQQDAARAATVSSLPFKQTLAAMIDQGVPPEQALEQTIKLFPLAEGYRPNYRTVQPAELPDGLAGPPQAQRIPVLPPSAPGELIQATDEETRLNAYNAPGPYGAAARAAGAKVPISSGLAQALQDETLKRLRSSDAFTTHEMGVQIDGRGNVLLNAKERTQPLYPEGFTSQVAGFERFREVPTVYPGVVTIEADPAFEARTTAAAGVVGRAEGEQTRLGGTIDPTAIGKTPAKLSEDRSLRDDARKEEQGIATQMSNLRAAREQLGQLEDLTLGVADPKTGERHGSPLRAEPFGGTGSLADIADRGLYIAGQQMKAMSGHQGLDNIDRAKRVLRSTLAKALADQKGNLNIYEQEAIEKALAGTWDTIPSATANVTIIRGLIDAKERAIEGGRVLTAPGAKGATGAGMSPLRQKLLQKYGG